LNGSNWPRPSTLSKLFCANFKMDGQAVRSDLLHDFGEQTSEPDPFLNTGSGADHFSVHQTTDRLLHATEVKTDSRKAKVELSIDSRDNDNGISRIEATQEFIDDTDDQLYFASQDIFDASPLLRTAENIQAAIEHDSKEEVSSETAQPIRACSRCGRTNLLRYRLNPESYEDICNKCWRQLHREHSSELTILDDEEPFCLNCHTSEKLSPYLTGGHMCVLCWSYRRRHHEDRGAN
jgi:hypothetical protein